MKWKDHSNKYYIHYSLNGKSYTHREIWEDNRGLPTDNTALPVNFLYIFSKTGKKGNCFYALGPQYPIQKPLARVSYWKVTTPNRDMLQIKTILWVSKT